MWGSIVLNVCIGMDVCNILTLSFHSSVSYSNLFMAAMIKGGVNVVCGCKGKSDEQLP